MRAEALASIRVFDASSTIASVSPSSRQHGLQAAVGTGLCSQEVQFYRRIMIIIVTAAGNQHEYQYGKEPGIKESEIVAYLSYIILFRIISSCSQIIRQWIGIHQQHLFAQERDVFIGQFNACKLLVDVVSEVFFLFGGIMTRRRPWVPTNNRELCNCGIHAIVCMDSPVYEGGDQ